MELNSLKIRFGGKRIEELGRFERYDLLEHYMEVLANEISRMDPKPEAIILFAQELQPTGVLSHFEGLLRERYVGSQVKISNDEPARGYPVNLDERVQAYIDEIGKRKVMPLESESHGLLGPYCFDGNDSTGQSSVLDDWNQK